MNIKHERIEAIRVPLEKPFSDFYVMITPMDNDPGDGKDWRDFRLYCKGHGIVIDMGGSSVENDDEAIEYAYYDGPTYIPDWIERGDVLEEYYTEKFFSKEA